jgi:hypothetical protein
MPHLRTATKTPICHAQGHRTVAAAGPHGIARRPPAYGIGMVDRAPAGDGPFQSIPDLMRGTGSGKLSPAPGQALVQPLATVAVSG